MLDTSEYFEIINFLQKVKHNMFYYLKQKKN